MCLDSVRTEHPDTESAHSKPEATFLECCPILVGEIFFDLLQLHIVLVINLPAAGKIGKRF